MWVGFALLGLEDIWCQACHLQHLSLCWHSTIKCKGEETIGEVRHGIEQKKGREMTEWQETEVSIRTRQADQGRSLRIVYETTPEKHQPSKPFAKHQKQILLDTNGLVKRPRWKGKIATFVWEYWDPALLFSVCLTFVKEPFTSRNGVEDLSFLNIWVRTSLTDG